MATFVLITFVQVSALAAEPPDFDQACQESLTSGRPLVVLVGASWCAACQQMSKSILPQVAEDGGLEKVIFVYVDFDRQRQLASRLSRGGTIPQLIRFDRKTAGWTNKRLIGAKSPREVHAFINAGLPDDGQKSKDQHSSTVQAQERSSQPGTHAEAGQPSRSQATASNRSVSGGGGAQIADSLTSPVSNR